MATLYITEYATAPIVSGHPIAIAAEPGVTTQTVTPITASAQSAAFSAQTRYIGVICDGIFSYSIGSNPTATTSTMRIPADTLVYFAVTPTHKIAAITNT